jgi:hypothetical protein
MRDKVKKCLYFSKWEHTMRNPEVEMEMKRVKEESKISKSAAAKRKSELVRRTVKSKNFENLLLNRTIQSVNYHQ